MPFSQLAAVEHRLAVGQPLPFNVLDADQTLLLARGQVVQSCDQMQALFTRGALVDLAELRTPLELIAQAAPQQLPQLWNQCLEQVGQALQQGAHEGFAGALDEAGAPVHALIERDPDLAIFQVLSRNANAHTQYGVDHSVHTAITAFLVAQRLGWDEAARHTVFKVGLTMNLSMLELQGQLAEQTTPLTSAQREAIHSHPQRSVDLLRLAGIAARDWLDGVADHHETADGRGYPAAKRDINDFAALVHRADIYTAKLSPRRTRAAMAADAAGRAMFMGDPGHSMTQALVKEFGVYPPGCFVKLVSGEIAIVVKRGASVVTPWVAALTTPSGAALIEPQPRDTRQRDCAIAAVVGANTVAVRVAPQQLMALALG